ncbi:MAG: DUF5906 domain-containing protein [Hyphomicrobium sp.]
MERPESNQATSAGDVTPVPVNGHSEIAVEFLTAMHPTGLWSLTAIDAETGKTQSAAFDSKSAAKALAWIALHNGKSNLYFAVNPTREAMSKKAKATDIAALTYLHVDIDPRKWSEESRVDKAAYLAEERARILSLLTDKLPAGVPKPTATVFSGGGYQAFWQLSDPLTLDGSVEAAEKAKLWNLGLERKFGCADSCHNIDRIMRLPGTINVPNNKKRASGRVPTLAALVEADWSLVYPLSRFEPGSASSALPKGDNDNAALDVDPNAERVKFVDVNDLDKHTADGKSVDDRVKRIIQAGFDEYDDRLGSKPQDDRSRWVFDVACDLVRRGVPDHVILAVLLDKDFRISDHIYEQKQGAEKYAIRQIRRAKEAAIDPQLAELNDVHAVLLQEGGKTRVLSWESSELDANLEVPVLQSFEDFQKRYMNRTVEVGVDRKGNPKCVKLGRWWLEHSQRREYKALRFMPTKGEVHDGYLNLWKGFGVEATPGDWGTMRKHVLEVLAGGDAAVCEYILKWTAWSVQNPDRPAEVALVFRGGRGTGKGTFARWIKRLFGHHGLQITSSMQLTGRFNKHLRSCCLLFADEAIAPNDKTGESILKGLITEPEVIIEGKGLDAIQARNHLHIVMASNESWVVPSGIDERRFAVFEVSKARVDDKAYFGALEAEMTNGGLAAMLHDLLELDLEGWHPRDSIPQTRALAEQKAQSLRGFERIMFDLLKAGVMPIEIEPADVQNGSEKVRTMILKAYAKREWPREHVTLNSVADVLTALGWQQFRGSFRGFCLPTLPEARAMWSAKYFEAAWDGSTAWELIASDLEGRPEAMIPAPTPLKLVTSE